MQTSKEAAIRQLRALYESAIDEGLKVLVCGRDNFAGRWFDDLEAAADWALAKAETVDVWVGMGVRKIEPGEGERGDMAGVGGIPGFWCDLDVADETAHKKKNLIKTFEEARAFVKEMFPFAPPSLVINSGHGLQAYWLFNEAWIFKDDKEREKAYRLSERFSATIKAYAKIRGFDVDSTFNIDRILRLAGTVNRKSKPVPTTIEFPEDPAAKLNRYEPADLEALLVAPEMVPNENGKTKALDPVGYLFLSAARQPPAEALVALIENNEKAAASWNRKRTDLQDQSTSSYDFSLAVLACKGGWTDQEIADLLIAWRVKHGLEPKSNKNGIRLDYYQRTISKARAICAKEKLERFEADSEVPIVGRGEEVPKDEKKKIIEKVRRIFDLPIEKFIQRGSGDDSLFSFLLVDGTVVPIGTAEILDNQSKIRAKVYPIAHRFPMRMVADSWDRMMAALGSIVEVVDNPESSRAGKFASLLTEYLTAKTSCLKDEWTHSLQSGDPFIKEGSLFIGTTNLESWIRFGYTRKVSTHDLWTDFPVWGFKTDQVQHRVAGRKVSRRYWHCPLKHLEDSFGFSLPMVGSDTDGKVQITPEGGSAGSAGSALEALGALPQGTASKASGTSGGPEVRREGSKSLDTGRKAPGREARSPDEPMDFGI